MVGNLSTCGDGTKFLAGVGAVTIYLIIGVLTSSLLYGLFSRGKKFKELTADQRAAIIYGGLVWPATYIVLAGLGIVRLITNILFGATIFDLEKVERSLSRKIEQAAVPAVQVKTKFQVGDLIKGIKGNPDNYKKLNEGCVCRVNEINAKGQMKVTLVDHKDYKKNVASIGKEFNAPARNFVKYK